MTASTFSTITVTPFTGTSTLGLIDIFAKVAHLTGSILLDTAGSSKSNGRFNIMLWNPAITVTAQHGKKVCIQVRNKTPFCTDLLPFEAAEHFLHDKVKHLTFDEQVDKRIQALPFIVGVAGYAGYDTGRFYEQLPDNAMVDVTTPDFSAGLYLQSLIEDTQTGEIFYCSAEGLSAPIDIPEQAEHTPFSLTSNWQSNLSKEEYLSRIERIHRYLRAGDCYQVNMAQRFSAAFSGSPWHAYRTLRNSNQAPFSAYIQCNDSTILSISPERFLSVKNGMVETKPIKGTRPRSSDREQDLKNAESLLSAEKDRAENLMIVDLLRNDISKHCKPHSVQVPALFSLESYEAVHHLVSTVIGALNDEASPLHLLASAFPGGSITGAPKIRAMEIIDELEKHRRNIYCGSIFYMGFRQDMDSSICIRTILAHNNQLHCWAGGGIVIDSIAQEEYEETLDKVSKILPVLEQFFGKQCDKN